MKAVVISFLGSVHKVDVQENGEPLYAQIRSVIGGYMENTYPKNLPDDYIMIVNEEGKLNRLPVNTIATIVYGSDVDFIVGNTIILKFGKFEGESDVVGMTEEEADNIMACIHQEIIKNKKARLVEEDEQDATHSADSNLHN